MPEPKTVKQLITFFAHGFDGRIAAKITKKIKKLASVATITRESCAKNVLFFYRYDEHYPYYYLVSKLIMSSYRAFEPEGFEYAPFVPIGNVTNGNLSGYCYKYVEKGFVRFHGLPKKEAFDHILATAEQCADVIGKRYFDEVVCPSSLPLYQRIPIQLWYSVLNWWFRSVLKTERLIDVSASEIQDYIDQREKGD